MSEDIRPESGGIPPRVTIKVPGQSGEVSAAAAGSKKKTARIGLDQTTADTAALSGAHVENMGVASKTIRLAPAMTGQLSVSPLPSIGKALSGTFAYDDVKRQTSRIPLEAVLPAIASASAQPGSAAAASALPKTIKVKRPSISLSPNMNAVKAEETPPSPAVEPTVSTASKNQTSRVEVTPEMVPEPQQTQKKTIKIRRADGESRSVEPRNVAIARSGDAVAAGESSASSAGVGQVSQPHGAFIGIAAAAFLVLCFMIYVLAAQAYPNLGWSV